jgi:DnaB-like helicase N terminal domain/Protein of unknown function (DUF3987)
MNTATAVSPTYRPPSFANIAPPLPSNLDAERDVLGAILLNNKAIEEVMGLNSDDFFLDQHRRVFARMLAMNESQQPIDLTTLTEELNRHGDLEAAGGAAFIASLPDGFPKVSNVAHYAKIVREKALLRSAIHKADAVQKMAFSGDSAKSVVEHAAQSFVELANLSAEPQAEPVEQLPKLSEDALYGVAGDIVKKLMPETESHPAGMLIETLMSFGNIIGRGAYYEVEDTKHFGNLFAVKVGITAKARKGTASARISHIFEQVDPEWFGKRNFSGLSTGEGVIDKVRDPRIEGDKLIDEGVVDQRMFVYEGEFSSPLAVMKREGNTLSPVIRNAWDGKKLQSMAKNSPACSLGAHISILADITVEELMRSLSISDQSNGFANRFLWLHVERCGRQPFGGGELDFTDEIRRLKEAVTFAKWPSRRIYMDRNAREMWKRNYERLSEGQPGLFGAVTARAEAQVVRLVLLYAMLDDSHTPVWDSSGKMVPCTPNHIRTEHLKAAMALWQYAEDSARFIFGGLTVEQRRIVGFLADGPRTRTEIYAKCFQKNRASKAINADIEALLKAGQIVQVKEGRSELFALPS